VRFSFVTTELIRNELADYAVRNPGKSLNQILNELVEKFISSKSFQKSAPKKKPAKKTK